MGKDKAAANKSPKIVLCFFGDQQLLREIIVKLCLRELDFSSPATVGFSFEMTIVTEQQTKIELLLVFFYEETYDGKKIVTEFQQLANAHPNSEFSFIICMRLNFSHQPHIFSQHICSQINNLLPTLKSLSIIRCRTAIIQCIALKIPCEQKDGRTTDDVKLREISFMNLFGEAIFRLQQTVVKKSRYSTLSCFGVYSLSTKSLCEMLQDLIATGNVVRNLANTRFNSATLPSQPSNAGAAADGTDHPVSGKIQPSAPEFIKTIAEYMQEFFSAYGDGTKPDAVTLNSTTPGNK
jgi:hypothetical protein